MTRLNVALNDQTLVAAEKVKLASGDIDSVFLTVEFDSSWSPFTVRTASFHTSTNPSDVEALLIDNQCTIPPEVLANPGILYVGIIGVSADGKTVKTSSYAPFKVVQGANHSYTTIKPALDLYMQYLNAMDDKVDPVLKSVLTGIETFKKETAAELKANMVELWVNPSPTEEFSAQTIAMDLSEYARVTVVFRHGGVAAEELGNGYSESTCCQKDLDYHHNCGVTIDTYGDARNYWRTFRFTDNGIVFSDAYIHPQPSTDKNDIVVPYKIIGYKY